ncbi:hypothetical protein [Roseomonas marmotae]|uniref:Uncharacterized protein n=1 Tax=Roseomonas marmotae TaxID=2768161 RepID=A0ABS3KIF6_9PROT|nr:hypothetical protein [Roseomonas marmotae]MBO1077239.1 hypothetical protein [Roseomonas marmotae]QTI81076.1 hypothetical protein IAI58_17010 [Roseomonas marmotae]
MSRFLTAAAAALISLSAASAFATPLTVLSQGETFAVQYDPSDTGSIVGGGAVRVMGQGESQQITHVEARFAHRMAGIPVFTGGSEGGIAYLPAGASSSVMASR